MPEAVGPAMTTAMDLVTTLVAPDALTATHVRNFAASLDAYRAERLGARAVDLYHVGDLASARMRVGDFKRTAAVDAIVQPLSGRRKRLLVSDMDSTLIGQECIDELAAQRGLKERVARITERAMRGEVEFATALRERVELLRGVPLSAIDDLLARVITLSPGATDLVAACKRAGIRTVLVSGGFTAFADPIASRLGMDAAYANRLLSAHGVLTGELAEPILGAQAKRTTLQRECDALGIAPEEAIALGDGANDLAMIAAAGLGLAYRAKPEVAAVADGAIEHTDLRTVIYALGLGSDTADNGALEPYIAGGEVAPG